MGEEEEGRADEDEDEEDGVARVAVDEGGEGDRHRAVLYACWRTVTVVAATVERV